MAITTTLIFLVLICSPNSRLLNSPSHLTSLLDVWYQLQIEPSCLAICLFICEYMVNIGWVVEAKNLDFLDPLISFISHIHFFISKPCLFQNIAYISSLLSIFTTITWTLLLLCDFSAFLTLQTILHTVVLATLNSVNQIILFICSKLLNVVPLHLEVYPGSLLKLTKPTGFGLCLPLALDHISLVSLAAIPRTCQDCSRYLECSAPGSLHGWLHSFKFWS